MGPYRGFTRLPHLHKNMKQPLALTGLLVFSLACSSGLESDGQPVDVEPGYRLGLVESLESDNSGYVPIVDGLRTEWNLGSGIVVLGPEDEVLSPGEAGPPLRRLELHLGATEGNGTVAIDNAIYSTTDVQFGTAEELNGKLYTLAASRTCSVTSISDGHISVLDVCRFQVERVLVTQNALPETLNLGVTFTAVDR